MASEKPKDQKEDESGRPRAILTKGGTVSVPDRTDDDETKELPPRQRTQRGDDDDDDKQDEKEAVLETRGKGTGREPDDIPITDWFRNNQHPEECLELFLKNDIANLSDLGRVPQQQLDEILSNLPVTDDESGAKKARLVRDITNYRKVFVLPKSLYPDDAKKEQPVVDKAKANFRLGYLGLYKCVIMDYLFHKRIGEPPSITVVQAEDSTRYTGAVGITLPDINDLTMKTSECIITGLAFGDTAVEAEFKSFKDLFDKMVAGHGYVDSTTFHGLIRKYRTYKYIYQRSRRSNEEVWLYFWGFRRHRSATVYNKAKYFFDKNNHDAIGGKKSWIPLRIEKQGVWFDGFYYLFREEIETDPNVYNMIVLEQTELIFLWMRSYTSRMEFFGNVMRLGLFEGLRALSQKE